MAARQPRARGQRPPWPHFERSAGEAPQAARADRQTRQTGQTAQSRPPRSILLLTRTTLRNESPEFRTALLTRAARSIADAADIAAGRQRARRSPSSRLHGPRQLAGSPRIAPC